MSRLSPHAVGIVLALAGAMAFSGKAIIVKLSYRYGVDAVTVIMYRMLFALPFFMAMAWWASLQPHALAHPLSRRDMLAISGLGFLGYYLASFLDFLGLQTVSAGLERLIIYLNPPLVMLLSALVYKNRIQPQRALAMGISYAGVLLVFAHEVSFSGAGVVLGSVLVLASALAYAFYLMFSGEMVKRIGALRLVGLASMVACLCYLLQFVILKPLSSALVQPQVLWLGLLNATVCTVAPVVFIMLGIERIGAALTAQVGMVGPMSTISLGVLVLGEPVNMWIVLGTVLVLSGVYMASQSGEKTWT
ncbi:MAG: DMT family transporter [Limnohabitans sp.]|nr:DMT family transporter [Limnohabitans sp.]